jgi:hypothetical protein
MCAIAYYFTHTTLLCTDETTVLRTDTHQTADVAMQAAISLLVTQAPGRTRMKHTNRVAEP